MDTEIEEAAAYAARLIVDQHCSWALARTKLTEAFGKRCPMPSGADVETAVREHLSIFYPDHPALLAALRAEAAAVMRDLAEAGITAYLAGPVLNGAATDDSNITLECFAESGKDAELALLNLNINWEPIDPQATPSLHPIEALGWLRPIRRGSPLSRLLPFAHSVGVSLEVLPLRDHGANPRKRAPDIYQTDIEASGRASLDDLLSLLRDTAHHPD